MRQDMRTQALYMATFLALFITDSAQARSIVFKTVGPHYCDDSYPWPCYDTPTYCNTLSLPDDTADSTWANLIKACPMLTESNEQCQSEPRNECTRFSFFSGFYQDICSPPSVQISTQDCPGYFAGFYRQWDSVVSADNGAGHACVKDFLSRTTCSQPVWGTAEDIGITIALGVMAAALLCCVACCAQSCRTKPVTFGESLLQYSSGDNYGAMLATQEGQVTTQSVNIDNVECGPDDEDEVSSSPTFSTVHDLLSSISIFRRDLAVNQGAPDADSDKEELDVENPELDGYQALVNTV